MATYILILYLKLGYGQEEIKFQNFTHKQACEQAIVEIRNFVPDVKAICIPA